MRVPQFLAVKDPTTFIAIAFPTWTDLFAIAVEVMVQAGTVRVKLLDSEVVPEVAVTVITVAPKSTPDKVPVASPLPKPLTVAIAVFAGVKCLLYI